MVGFVNALAILNKGKHVTIVGMNDASAERHERLAGHLGGGH
jgi:SulP family sulfate permease